MGAEKTATLSLAYAIGLISLLSYQPLSISCPRVLFSRPPFFCLGERLCGAAYLHI